MRSLLALVADPDPAHREMLAASLRGGGFLVVTSVAEEDLLRAARDRSPDLILLDTRFAGDGWRIVEILGGEAATCEIPVIAVSGDDLLADPERLWNSGFCGYLKKPVASGSLVAAVRFCLTQTNHGADWVDLSSF